jgi:hypothetical protein
MRKSRIIGACLKISVTCYGAASAGVARSWAAAWGPMAMHGARSGANHGHYLHSKGRENNVNDGQEEWEREMKHSKDGLVGEDNAKRGRHVEEDVEYGQ